MKDVLLYIGPEYAQETIESILGSSYKILAPEGVPDKVIPIFEECDIFFDASMKVPVSADNIHNAKNLKLIVTATTGANHIDQKALEQRGVPLLTLKGQKEILQELTPAAEQSWLLLMACARHLRDAIHHVEDSQWNRVGFPGIMLKGKTIGIIGLGRIGSWMARYASAFGMKVQAYDPFNDEVNDGIEMVDINHLLSTSDFITVHVHLTPETAQIIDAERIKLFKRGSIFINTSRAELVDVKALINALKEGRIVAVGVDVLFNEPDIKNDPLWQHSIDHYNVIISPHIGGYCPEAVIKVVEFSAKRILKYFANN
jgi:D-3-phosphoglycerate dehydrogenase